MKIFITGVAGFLGSNLAFNLIDRGYDVSGNGNLICGYKDNISSDINFFDTDCCNFIEMKNSMKECDVLIHCSATAHEGLSSFSPSFITKNIFHASVTTFSAAISNNVKKIIYCSSMARYGNQKHPFVEEMRTEPCDPYGIAKVAAENILVNLCNLHGIEWTILVPHNIVGPRQRYDDPYRNVLSIFLNRMLQDKPALIYGDGSQKRCFSYVDDCVNSIVNCIENKKTNKEIINIGPDEESITIKELANKCANIVGINSKHKYLPARPQEVKFATCSSNKARKILNYKTKFSLDQSIHLTKEYIEKRGASPFNYNIDLEIINNQTPKTWKNKLI